ncbi:MAG: hypothetical protein P8P74_05625 [Crocinitomicaceae bacterium]|nr:hypothetical protein [Crocinitomicaceae bacterium]
MNVYRKLVRNSRLACSCCAVILFFYLFAAQHSAETWDYKLPDEIGNLFKTKEKKDRKYGKAGQLLKDEKYSYTYDEIGNLIEKE